MRPCMLALLLSAGRLFAIAVFSAGGLVTDGTNVNGLGPASLGNLCVHAAADGVLGGAGNFAGGPGGPLLCQIPPPMPPGFAGPYLGQGIFAVPKFPAPAGANGVMGPVIGPLGTLSTPSAQWTSATTPGFFGGFNFSATHRVSANVNTPLAAPGASGTAVGWSNDPLEFIADFESELLIRLIDVSLWTSADPGELALAFILASFRLTSEGEVISEGEFLQTVSGPDGSYSLPELTLADLWLEPGRAYSLELNLKAGALAQSVPEPSSGVYAITALLAGGWLCRRRRSHRVPDRRGRLSYSQP